jgi:hypothetical protein
MEDLMRSLRASLNLVLLLVLSVALPASGVTLHATDNTNDALYTIDTSDGSYSVVGYYTLNNPGTEVFIGGLAYDTGLDLFYGVSASSAARLYTVNPNDASTTDIGPLNIGFVYEGGLAFDPVDGTLYGVNQGSASSPALFTVNTTTGAGTVVGQIAGGSHDFAGLVFDAGGQLYGLDRVTNALWKISKTNPFGAGTVQVGAGLGNPISMGDVGGMAKDASGVVYGYAGGSLHLFTVNLATGAGTVIHTYGAADPVFFSLAFSTGSSPVEPRSWGSIKSLFR